jgi:hypothetical protein
MNNVPKKQNPQNALGYRSDPLTKANIVQSIPQEKVISLAAPVLKIESVAVVKSDPVTQAGSQMSSDVSVFFHEHFKKISSKNLEGVLEDYDDRVEWFKSGQIVDKAFIRLDEIKDFSKNDKITETVTGIEEVSGAELSYRVFTTNNTVQRLDKAQTSELPFPVQNKVTSKKVENTFKLKRVASGFLIVSQFARILQ